MIASVAPFIDVSNSGDDTACFAASTALFSPDPTPIPIRAFPLSFITALTSAKSRFTNPDTAIKSEIDCTPLCNTLSTSLNASNIGVDLSINSLNLSFGITINVSTCFFNSSKPVTA